MTRRYSKIIDVIRRAIEEHMEDRLPTGIGQNTVIEE
jgi:hypothetical protein